MGGASNERAVWLADHVLVHEPALRAWLGPRRVAGLEIDDIVQETYAILARLDSVADIRNPRAYLFQVARSVLLQYVRRSKVVVIEALEEIEYLNLVSETQSPERQVSDRQELRLFAEVVAGLPPKRREAFVLRKIEGLSQRQIAERMGVSESTVEKHIAQGLQAVMQLYKHLGIPGFDASRKGSPTGAVTELDPDHVSTGDKRGH